RARRGQVLNVKTRPADALRRKGKGIEGGDDSVTPAGPGPAAGQQTGRDNNENDSLNHSLEDTLPSWPRKRAHGRETHSRRSPSRSTRSCSPAPVRTVVRAVRRKPRRRP